MHRLKILGSALVVALVLVTCADYATYAATGKSLILGHANSANTLTNVTRTTSGPVLNLKTRLTTNAPFSTTGTGRVTHLNADKVDGLDSTAMANTSLVFTRDVTTATTDTNFVVNVPAGSYTFGYSAFLEGAENGNVYCQLYDTGSAGTTYVGISQFTAGTLTPGLSGAGLVTRHAGDTLTFECAASNPFTTVGGVPIQLVLSPTKVSSSSNVRTAPRLHTTAHAAAGR